MANHLSDANIFLREETVKTITFVFLSLCAVQGLGAALDLGKAKNSIEFLAVGQPSALRVRGRANSEKVSQPLKGSLAITAHTLLGTATFALAALETGIELRDSHMKEKYLEVKKYPDAELTLTRLDLPESHKGENLPFEGTLSLHGVKKTVKGLASVDKTESNLSAKFEFKIKLDDFGIQIPSYMGIKIANEVTVNSASEGMVQ